jgi:hypothetical protein
MVTTKHTQSRKIIVFNFVIFVHFVMDILSR